MQVDDIHLGKGMREGGRARGEDCAAGSGVPGGVRGREGRSCKEEEARKGYNGTPAACDAPHEAFVSNSSRIPRCAPPANGPPHTLLPSTLYLPLFTPPLPPPPPPIPPSQTAPRKPPNFEKYWGGAVPSAS